MKNIIQTSLTPNLLDFLTQKGILARNLLGAIEHVDNLKLYVDNLENPTGVIGHEDYFYYVVSDNASFIEEMMTTFFTKDGYYGFSGISRPLAETILTKDVQEHWRHDCYLYSLPRDLDLPSLDPRIESLTLDDLKEVHYYYEYQSDTSMGDIKEDILKRPSACIRVNGELAAWVLVHRDDTMGIMYTKETYRKQDLAYHTAIGLMHKLHDLGKTPYVQIHTSNNASQGLVRKLGLIKADPIVTWFGIVVGDLPLDDD